MSQFIFPTEFQRKWMTTSWWKIFQRHFHAHLIYLLVSISYISVLFQGKFHSPTFPKWKSRLNFPASFVAGEWVWNPGPGEVRVGDGSGRREGRVGSTTTWPVGQWRLLFWSSSWHLIHAASAWVDPGTHCAAARKRGGALLELPLGGVSCFQRQCL